MATITGFEDIRAWQTARQLTNAIYDMAEQGPFARDYGLRNQIQRAAVSVMSNIAEGLVLSEDEGPESRTQARFIDYLGHAKGSAGEVRAQLYVALDRGYIVQEQFDAAYELADKAARQVHRFMTYLETKRGTRRIREGRIEYEI